MYFSTEKTQIICGCFKGNLIDFENEVNKTHKNNPRWLAEYTKQIEIMKFLIKNI
jgi:penicillin-binding protein-related factor A (putative recombinase)